MTSQGAANASPDLGPDRVGEAPHETHRMSGDRLLEFVMKIVREGRARRVGIRNQEGRVLLAFPLEPGVPDEALLPLWAAVGVAAALAKECSVEVEVAAVQKRD